MGVSPSFRVANDWDKWVSWGSGDVWTSAIRGDFIGGEIKANRRDVSISAIVVVKVIPEDQ